MANDINSEAYRLAGDGNLMGRYLSDQAALGTFLMRLFLTAAGRFWRNRALRLLSPLPILKQAGWKKRAMAKW